MKLARLRERLVVFVFVVVATWPAVQIHLVDRYHVDPWKLFGWGMYSTPMNELVFGYRSPDPVDDIGGDDVAPLFQRAIHRFESRRWAVGLLTKPNAVAAAAFAETPELTRLRITVVTRKFDPRAAQMGVADISHYFYRRGEWRPFLTVEGSEAWEVPWPE